MSIGGVSYVQDLHSADRLMEFDYACGREVISIVPAEKDTYQIRGMDVAKVFEWGEKMSYFQGSKREIYWGNSTAYNHTNIFQDVYETDIPY